MGHSAAVWDYRVANEVTKDWNGNPQVVLRNPQGASTKRKNLDESGNSDILICAHWGLEEILSLNNGRRGYIHMNYVIPRHDSYLADLQIIFGLGSVCMGDRSCHGKMYKGKNSYLPAAIFKPPKPMRGGIPICFPQFGNRGSLEQHGFARNKVWSIEDNPPPLPASDSNGKSFVDLILKPSSEDLKFWPHSFEYRLRVALGTDGRLSLVSRIRNVNGKPFTFSFAYHTYMSVSDISEVRIEGLETLDYFDNLFQRERCTEQGDALTFESEVDRVYLSCPNAIAVIDHGKKRTFVIRKEGLPDVVVWNPWDKKSKAMLDFGDEEYKHMLCVDGAVVENPITLKPGEEWLGRIELMVVPSSFCSDHLDLHKVHF